MPTVPRYNSQVGLGISQGRQNIQASPGAFGAAEARALGSVSGGINQIAQRMEEIQLEDDETAAREALLATSDELRDLQRGEGGYLTTAGRDAVEGYDDYQARVDEIINGRMSSLNDRQREMYEAAVMSRRESALNSGASHAANQRREYQVTVFGAQLEDATALALEGRGTPQFNEARDQAFHAIERAGRLQGMDAEQIERSQRQWLSQSRMAAVAAELDLGNVEAAEAIAEAAREGEEFAGTDATSVETMLRTANSARRVEQARDEIFGRFGSDMTAGLAYIRDNFEGDEETDIASAYRRLASDVMGSESDRSSARFSQVVEAFRNGDVQSIYDLDIITREALSDRQITLLREEFESGNGMYGRRVDVAQWERLATLAQTPDGRQELSRMDPTDFRQYVTNDEQYNELFDWWQSARLGQVADLPSLVSDAAALQMVMAEAGISGDEDTLAFQEAAQRAIAVEVERSAGGEISEVRRNEILREVAAEVTISGEGGLFRRDRTTRVGVASLGDTFEGVPAAHQQAIIQFFGDDVPEPEAIRPYYDAAMAEAIRQRGEPLGTSAADMNALSEWMRLQLEIETQEAREQEIARNVSDAAAREDRARFVRELMTERAVGPDEMTVQLRDLGYSDQEIIELFRRYTDAVPRQLIQNQLRAVPE